MNAAISPRRGFTLTEMLVILGIITIILAIALPAFTAVQGSRSVEAGQNIAAASIGRARAEAIRRGVTCGAFFFIDADGQTNVAFVALADGSTDPDPYDEYKPYAAGADYQGSTDNPLPDAEDEPAMTSDRVLALGVDNNATDYTGAYAGYQGRPIVLNYKHRNHPPNDPSADASIRPNGVAGFSPKLVGDSNQAEDFTNGFNNELWELSGGVSDLVLLTDIPIETLPNGVGLQIVTGAALTNGSGVTGATDRGTGMLIERYTRAGLIAFDRKGRLVGEAYDIDPDSPLGQRIGLPRGATLTVSSAIEARSGFGIVVYPNDEFEAAASDGTATHWQGSFFSTVEAEDSIDEFTTTDGDLNYFYPAGDRPTDLGASVNPPNDPRFHEYAEERWLDSNTTPRLVNRFSGTLVDNVGEQP